MRPRGYRPVFLAIMLCLALLALATPCIASSASTKWALLVGINEYRYASSVRYAAEDVKALRDRLVQDCGYLPDHVVVMTDDSKGEQLPTGGNIIACFESMAAFVGQNNSDDSFLFYFSGHGYALDQRQYLLPIDANIRTAGALEQSAVFLDKLQQVVRSMRARYVVFMIDACRTQPELAYGDRPHPLTDGLAKGVQVVARSAASGKAASATIFACSPGERAYFSDGLEHSLFGYYVSQGLAGEAVAPETGDVTVASLLRYLQQQVPLACERLYGAKKQNPWAAPEDLETTIVLAKPVRQPLRQEPLETEAFLSVSSIPSGAGVTVDGTAKGTTPCEIVVDLASLQERQLEVILQKEGYKSKGTKIRVARGRRSRWEDVVMEPVAGSAGATGAQHRRRPTGWPVKPLLAVDVGCQINDVAFSRDGQILAAAGRSTTVWLWDLEAKSALPPLVGSSAQVLTVAFDPADPSGRGLVVAGDAGKVDRWDLSTEPRTKAVRQPDFRVKSLAFSRDGRKVAALSSDGSQFRVNICEAATWKTNQAVDATTYGWGSPRLALSSDGSLLAVASIGFGSRLTVWNALTGQKVGLIREMSDWVGSVAFNPDGSMLASGNGSGVVLQHVPTRGGGSTVLRGHGATVTDVSFSQDGRVLASGYSDGTVQLWRAAIENDTPVCLHTLPGVRHPVTRIVFSPDDSLLAVACSGGEIELWEIPESIQKASDLGSGKAGLVVSSIPALATVYINGVKSIITPFAMELDFASGVSAKLELEIRRSGYRSQSVAAELKSGETIGWENVTLRPLPRSEATPAYMEDRPWDCWLRSRQPTRTVNQGSLVGCLIFDHDGTRLASSGANGTKLWMLNTGVCLSAAGDPQEEGYHRQVFTANGTLLVAEQGPNRLTIWDLTANRRLASIPLEDEVMLSAAVSKDGQHVAVVYISGKMELWGIRPVSKLATLGPQIQDDLYSKVVFSPDGALVAAGTTGGAVEVRTLAEPYRVIDTMFQEMRSTCGLEFSADGRILAALALDGGVTLWEMPSGKTRASLATLTGSRSEYGSSIAISDDGYLVASISDELELRLWRTDAPGDARTLGEYSFHTSCAAFSPDGKYLAVGYDDGAVRIWELAGIERHVGSVITVR
jgi:WD40 repeat protein/uncharacterized caspase-like protein